MKTLYRNLVSAAAACSLIQGAAAAQLRLAVTDTKGVTTVMKAAYAEYSSPNSRDPFNPNSISWKAEPGLIAYVGEGTVTIGWNKLKRLTATGKPGTAGINSYELLAYLADGKTQVLSFAQARVSGETDLGRLNVFISDIRDLQNLAFDQGGATGAASKVATTDSHHRVTFDNKSGVPVMVKLVGPTSRSVEVQDGGKGTMEVAPGHYVIKTRYGTPGSYLYFKGIEFDLEQTARSSPERKFKVSKLNRDKLPSRAISAEEFDRPAGPPGSK
jgi:hypothetical protein